MMKTSILVIALLTLTQAKNLEGACRKKHNRPIKPVLKDALLQV